VLKKQNIKGYNILIIKLKNEDLNKAHWVFLKIAQNTLIKYQNNNRNKYKIIKNSANLIFVFFLIFNLYSSFNIFFFDLIFNIKSYNNEILFNQYLIILHIILEKIAFGIKIKILNFPCWLYI
jgi:hypothetical protein